MPENSLSLEPLLNIHLATELIANQPELSDYFILELYRIPEHKIRFLLMQICQVCISQKITARNEKQAASLFTFISDLASVSVDCGLMLQWMCTSILQEKDLPPSLNKAALDLLCKIDTALLSLDISQREFLFSLRDVRMKRPDRTFLNETFPPERSSELSQQLDLDVSFTEILEKLSEWSEHSAYLACRESDIRPLVDWYNTLGSSLCTYTIKLLDAAPDSLHSQLRSSYVDRQTDLVKLFREMTQRTFNFPVTSRSSIVRLTLESLNQWIFESRMFAVIQKVSKAGSKYPMFSYLGVHLPFEHHLGRHIILKIHVNDTTVYTSRARAPILLIYETVDLDSADLDDVLRSFLKDLNVKFEGEQTTEALVTSLHSAFSTLSSSSWFRSDAPSKDVEDKPVTTDMGDRREKWSRLAEGQRQKIWGDLWQNRCERYRKQSPYSLHPTWSLNGLIFKSNDDVRQELLASQFVRLFLEIFQKAGLNLWLRAFDVVPTSANSGYMEYISDTVSIDFLKKKFPSLSLVDIFKITFSDKLSVARQNFVQSIAAYSLICYFLQVKDRHNGNLLIDREGHIIHIDFGFMFANSPGNLSFENSPFKLSQEFVDIMDGQSSRIYEYFRVLVIRGFLEARKEVKRLTSLISVFLNSKAACFHFPCFAGLSQESVIKQFEDRFFLDACPEVVVDNVLDLIDTSASNTRTFYYDRFQKMTNGIL